MSIDADTGLQIDPDENIPRLDVSGVADVIGYTDFDNFNMPIGSGLFDESGNVNLDFISSLTNDPAIFNAFTEFDPEAAAELRRLVGAGGNTRSFGGDQSGIATLDLGNVGGASTAGRDEVELAGPNYGDPNTILKQDDIDLQGSGAEGSGPNAKPDTKPGPNYGDPNTILKQDDIDLQEGTTDKIGTTTNKTGTTTNKTDTTGTNKGLSSFSDLLKYFLPALASYLSYKDAANAREEARGWSAPGGYAKQAVRSPGGGVTFKPAGKAAGGIASLAGGGIASLAGGGEFGKGTGLDFEMSMYSNGGMTTKQPFYLGGITDGMADEVPAHIDNKRPAALSDGEFVIPADVVSHLGNGNSNAGAKRLYEMMDRIREARTGNSKQGIQVNPNNFMPG